jgi:uncharacterized phage infection (PIP) family protein YhgE
MRRRYVLLAITSILAIALTVPALGGPGNPIATGAASAKKTAQKALKKAKQAKKAAKNAQTTADGAASAAAAAQTSADNAQSTANGAQTAAEAAQTSADAAQASADAAQASANSKYGDTDYVEGDTSATDSSASKTQAAGCVGSFTPSGGGYALAGTGANEVTVTLTSQYLSGWIVIAEEIGAGTANTWNLTTNVTCVGPTS